MKKLLLLVCLILAVYGGKVLAQELPAYAFTNVTLHHPNGKIVEKATLLWRDGSIEAQGTNVSLPFDAKVIDGGDSLHIYPGLIDGLGMWGSPEPPKNQSRPEKPGEPGYERAGIQPNRMPSELSSWGEKDQNALLKAGFTTLSLGLKGDFLPGQIDITHLNGSSMEDHLFAQNIAIQASLSTGNVYPSTLMGVLLSYRQLLENARTLQIAQRLYDKNPQKYEDPGRDKVLESMYPVINKEIPLFIEADTKENIERVIALSKELNVEIVLVSAKEGFKVVDLIKSNNIPVLVSLDLPEIPTWMQKDSKSKKDDKKEESEESEAEKNSSKVETPLPDDIKAFREKQENAYKAYVLNVQSLVEAGIKTGFASNGLGLKDLSKELKTLTEHGVDEKLLLPVFTQTTADILGYGAAFGNLEKGMLANFFVSDKPMLDEKTKILYSSVRGELKEMK